MAKITPGVKKVIKTETKKSESVSGPSSNINIRKKTVSNRTNTPTEMDDDQCWFSDPRVPIDDGRQNAKQRCMGRKHHL